MDRCAIEVSVERERERGRLTQCILLVYFG